MAHIIIALFALIALNALIDFFGLRFSFKYDAPRVLNINIRKWIKKINIETRERNNNFSLIVYTYLPARRPSKQRNRIIPSLFRALTDSSLLLKLTSAYGGWNEIWAASSAMRIRDNDPFFVWSVESIPHPADEHNFRNCQLLELWSLCTALRSENCWTDPHQHFQLFKLNIFKSICNSSDCVLCWYCLLNQNVSYLYWGFSGSKLDATQLIHKQKSHVE